ncbi:Glycine receptor subunit alpha-3 [Nymphon striatum]|nr:Glycine receptor subunit alpha-3 [Nymphon striatum]
MAPLAAGLGSITKSQLGFVNTIILQILFVEWYRGDPSQSADDLKTLDHLLDGYDRRIIPTAHNGTPTVVSCELYVRSFGAFDPEKMVDICNVQLIEYEADVYIRQRWRDPRLENRNMASYIDLSDTKLIKKIWKPDLYFPNAKSGWFQIVTVPNFLLRLYPSGEILYMLRLRLTFSCMMNLNRYPLDHQICPIELASFASTINDLVFIWKDNKAVKLYRDVKLAQFQIVDVYLHNCRESFHIGEYSCLRAELHLKRSIGFYLVQKYFPTMLIVFISWISFWLDVNAIPARVTVGVTTLLTITSESSDSQTKLAPVSYVKALDVWMGVCTTFVFAALIEFTIVNYLARKPFPSRPNVKVKFQNILLISSSNVH